LTFFSATNLNAILVSQSVTAILALAAMVSLATKQFDHLVLIVGLQVTQGLGWPLAAALSCSRPWWSASPMASW
jgi:ribose transport system permease protein